MAAGNITNVTPTSGQPDDDSKPPGAVDGKAMAAIASKPTTQDARPLEPESDAPADGTSLLVHFLEDGWTAFGNVWFRGQELEVVVGGDEWKRSLNVDGRSWLLLTKIEQIKGWGKHYFDQGPWPYDDWTDEEAKRQEAARARRPPVALTPGG